MEATALEPTIEIKNINFSYKKRTLKVNKIKSGVFNILSSDITSYIFSFLQQNASRARALNQLRLTHPSIAKSYNSKAARSICVIGNDNEINKFKSSLYGENKGSFPELQVTAKLDYKYVYDFSFSFHFYHVDSNHQEKKCSIYLIPLSTNTTSVIRAFYYKIVNNMELFSKPIFIIPKATDDYVLSAIKTMTLIQNNYIKMSSHFLKDLIKKLIIKINEEK